MKTVIAVLIILLSAGSVNAELQLRGQGTSVHGTYNLIYDTDFDITWYDYTHAGAFSYGDTWWNQMDWAAALSVNLGGNVYADWRLPSALNQDGSGPCLYGNCTDNEFGHLYYTELGNVYYGGLTYTGDFQNFIESWYWTGTEHTDTTGAWGFGANAGSLGGDGKIGAGTAIAVRDGNVTVVPEPISLTLFLVGGATIGVRRFIRKQVA